MSGLSFLFFFFFFFSSCADGDTITIVIPHVSQLPIIRPYREEDNTADEHKQGSLCTEQFPKEEQQGSTHSRYLCVP